MTLSIAGAMRVRIVVPIYGCLSFSDNAKQIKLSVRVTPSLLRRSKCLSGLVFPCALAAGMRLKFLVWQQYRVDEIGRHSFLSSGIWRITHRGCTAIRESSIDLSSVVREGLHAVRQDIVGVKTKLFFLRRAS